MHQGSENECICSSLDAAFNNRMRCVEILPQSQEK